MTDVFAHGVPTALSALTALAGPLAPGALPRHGGALFGWILLLAPLAGTLTIGVGHRRLSAAVAGWIGTGAIFASFAAAIACFFKLRGMEADARHIVSGYSYAQVLGVDFRFDIFIDPLSVFMALVVSGVSALIHLYSVAYMRGDNGYQRFFAYLNFFVFSMLLLVLAGNLALLVIGWAFVGAASYLLISFWYRRQTAVAAGIKAFVMNVVGDVGIVVAAFLLWHDLQTLSIPSLLAAAGDPFSVTPSATITAAALLLLVGAFAKSAQIPLHTWLPDAMEGPTPVSALIHAATMVTAGVYLIARFHAFFELSKTAALVGAIVGAATMLVAATTALVQNDLKRIIAYSTMSQIGYMVVGVCSAAYGAGLFHLMTHAFFKALLFMAAGSVIAAMGGTQDVRRMGGLRRAMPFTYATFGVGALTLAGFPLLSGFFSKDEIIAYAYHRGGAYAVIAFVLYLGAILTAFYSLRAVYLVFHGEPCAEARELEAGHLHHGEHVNPATGEAEDTDVGFPGADHHIAEREPTMKLAMGTLAALSVFAGLTQVPGVSHAVETFLDPTFADSRYLHDAPSNAAQLVGLAIGAAIALTGISLASFAYLRRRAAVARLAERMPRTHALLSNAWYFDAAYDRLFVRPAAALGRFANLFVERFVVKGIVDGVSDLVRAGAGGVRSWQSGLARVYAASVVIGVTAMVFYFVVVAR